MSYEAVLWIIITTILTGVHATLGKIIAQKKINIALNSVFNFLFSFIFFAIILIFKNQNLPENYLLIIYISLCGGFLYGISFIFRIKSLENIDSVLFFPINKILGPILAVLGGIFIFGEYLNIKQFIGVSLSILVPILLINKTEKIRQNNLFIGLIFLFISVISGIVQVYFLKYLLNLKADIFIIVTFMQFFAFVVSFLILFYENKKDKIVFKITKLDIYYGLFSGLIATFSFGTFVKALSLAPLSLLYTIHAHYILIPIIFSVFYYREHINFRKAMAVIISMLAISFLI